MRKRSRNERYGCQRHLGSAQVLIQAEDGEVEIVLVVEVDDGLRDLAGALEIKGKKEKRQAKQLPSLLLSYAM